MTKQIETTLVWHKIEDKLPELGFYEDPKDTEYLIYTNKGSVLIGLFMNPIDEEDEPHFNVEGWQYLLNEIKYWANLPEFPNED